ncbi:MAG: hypothetical protein EAZ30_02460 [Betaproteobacteria bacterium]|nr:MAG: hypothetical protein EAZ30_02460 [Betaproteobacteria bacterium]
MGYRRYLLIFDNLNKRDVTLIYIGESVSADRPNLPMMLQTKKCPFQRCKHSADPLVVSSSNHERLRESKLCCRRIHLFCRSWFDKLTTNGRVARPLFLENELTFHPALQSND